MTRSSLASIVAISVLGSACAAGAPAASTMTSPAGVPSGTIAFNRIGDDGVEHYFAIQSDGVGEHSLFSEDGCACLVLSPAGGEVWASSMTEAGMMAFTTMRADGSDRQVHEPSIATLNLVPGAGTADGQLIAFVGWDDADPSNSGLWIGAPDLTGLRQVMPLPDGVSEILPLGVTPDGARIVFFGQQGPQDFVTHAGALFVVNGDGTGLKQLSPEGVHVATVRGLPASLSPDGTRVAFAAFEGHPDQGLNAVYVVPVDGGQEAERLIEPVDGIWAVAWSPVGDVIAYSQWGSETRVSVVNADGTGQVDLTEPGEDVGVGVWSPEGDALLLRRGTQEAGDLWVIGADGTGEWQVTDEPAEYGMYAWGQ